MSITLTPAAKQQMQRALLRRGKGEGVRIGIRSTGCSGLSYHIEYADHIEDNERIFTEDELKVIIPEKDLPFLDGMQVDYRQEGINTRFVFENPHAKAQCGCGESFTV